MLTCFLAVTLLLSLRTQSSAIDTTVVFRPTRYDLDMKVDIPNKELVATARITLTNATSAPIRNGSFLLYRLMRVTDVRDGAGRPIAFTQPVVEFADHATLQVRQVNVALPRPLAAGGSTVVRIDYRGALLGYSETGMLYVQDRIDSAYSLLRMDAFAYPIAGVPSHGVNRRVDLPIYDYDARITVPEGFTVANGGQLIGTKANPGWTTFEYRNLKPAWRMDFGVARFGVKQAGSVRVFYLPEDSTGGARLFDVMNRTLDTYTRWFGPLSANSQFSLIEIPDGWGSQADVTSILQAAAAFKNPRRQYELYHELSHLWNVTETDRPPVRWNEGLAMFLQDLTTDSLESRMTTDSSADRVAAWLSARLKNDSSLGKVRMMDYGRMQMNGYSYSVGALMFYTLYKLMGHDAFSRLIAADYQRYHTAGGSADDFVRLAKQFSPVPVDQVFRDWLYSTRWTELVATTPGHTLPDHYKAAALH
ncbi:MAG TPA: M1 family aminopeptidase [Gemmatimonadaceae bacterium]